MGCAAVIGTRRADQRPISCDVTTMYHHGLSWALTLSIHATICAVYVDKYSEWKGFILNSQSHLQLIIPMILKLILKIMYV